MTPDTGHGAKWAQQWIADECLTPEEIADYRRFCFRFDGLRRRNDLIFGVRLRWVGIENWRIYLHTPWAFSFTFQTFEAYKRDKLSLGPYRKA